MPFIVPIEQVPLVLLKHAQLFCVSRFRVDHHVTNTYMFTFEYSFFFLSNKKILSPFLSLEKKKGEMGKKGRENQAGKQRTEGRVDWGSLFPSCWRQNGNSKIVPKQLF